MNEFVFPPISFFLQVLSFPCPTQEIRYFNVVAFFLSFFLRVPCQFDFFLIPNTTRGSAGGPVENRAGLCVNGCIRFFELAKRQMHVVVKIREDVRNKACEFRTWGVRPCKMELKIANRQRETDGAIWWQTARTGTWRRASFYSWFSVSSVYLVFSSLPYDDDLFVVVVKLLKTVDIFELSSAQLSLCAPSSSINPFEDWLGSF